MDSPANLQVDLKVLQQKCSNLLELESYVTRLSGYVKILMSKVPDTHSHPRSQLMIAMKKLADKNNEMVDQTLSMIQMISPVELDHWDLALTQSANDFSSWVCSTDSQVDPAAIKYATPDIVQAESATPSVVQEDSSSAKTYSFFLKDELETDETVAFTFHSVHRHSEVSALTEIVSTDLHAEAEKAAEEAFESAQDYFEQGQHDSELLLNKLQCEFNVCQVIETRKFLLLNLDSYSKVIQTMLDVCTGFGTFSELEEILSSFGRVLNARKELTDAIRRQATAAAIADIEQEYAFVNLEKVSLAEALCALDVNTNEKGRTKNKYGQDCELIKAAKCAVAECDWDKNRPKTLEEAVKQTIKEKSLTFKMANCLGLVRVLLLATVKDVNTFSENSKTFLRQMMKQDNVDSFHLSEVLEGYIIPMICDDELQPLQEKQLRLVMLQMEDFLVSKKSIQLWAQAENVPFAQTIAASSEEDMTLYAQNTTRFLSGITDSSRARRMATVRSLFCLVHSFPTMRQMELERKYAKNYALGMIMTPSSKFRSPEYSLYRDESLSNGKTEKWLKLIKDSFMEASSARKQLKDAKVWVELTERKRIPYSIFETLFGKRRASVK